MAETVMVRASLNLSSSHSNVFPPKPSWCEKVATTLLCAISQEQGLDWSTASSQYATTPSVLSTTTLPHTRSKRAANEIFRTPRVCPPAANGQAPVSGASGEENSSTGARTQSSPRVHRLKRQRRQSCDPPEYHTAVIPRTWAARHEREKERQARNYCKPRRGN